MSKPRVWPGNQIEKHPWQIKMHDELCDILEEQGHSETSIVQISVGIWGGMKAMQDYQLEKLNKAKKLLESRQAHNSDCYDHDESFQDPKVCYCGAAQVQLFLEELQNEVGG